MRVLVLGAGFGGLELSTRLSEQFGDDVDVVLIDKSDAFVFGFSKLDVMFGRAARRGAPHLPRRRQAGCGVRPGDGAVHRSGRQAGGDRRGVVRGRVLIGVLSTPYKCPPAPSETALLLHDNLVRRALRERSEIALVIDFPRPIPPSPDASAALLTAFAEQGIAWHAQREVCELDPARNVATLRDGAEMEYDLFLGVPVHRAPQVVVDAGLTESGWIPVNPLTMETSHPGVFAIGDGQFAKVDVTFFGDQRQGALLGPSAEYAADKVEFGASRIKRWSGGSGGRDCWLIAEALEVSRPACPPSNGPARTSASLPSPLRRSARRQGRDPRRVRRRRDHPARRRGRPPAAIGTLRASCQPRAGPDPRTRPAGFEPATSCSGGACAGREDRPGFRPFRAIRRLGGRDGSGWFVPDPARNRARGPDRATDRRRSRPSSHAACRTISQRWFVAMS